MEQNSKHINIKREIIELINTIDNKFVLEMILAFVKQGSAY